jgi:hypothetical protein
MVSVLVHLKLQMKHGSRPAHCTKGGFLWVCASMVRLLEQVCVCIEWLDWKSPCFNYLSFPAEFLELLRTST